MESYREAFTGRYRIDYLQSRAAHAGLWFDRFLRGHAETQEPGEQLVEQCARLAEPPGYATYFGRWVNALVKMGVQPRKARVSGRLAVGHGRDSVIETGISLHHTYGVPYIPGSSLKGTAATYAHTYLSDTLWRRGSAAHETLFGTTKSAGYVTFFDALPVPGEWKLLPDVLTVHHPSYYRGQNEAPADWDNPTPIPFLTATGSFLIALYTDADAAAWVGAGYGILDMALRELGVGGKTSSGYGRLILGDPLPVIKEGAMLRARVTGEDAGDLDLTFIDAPFGLPDDKDVLVYIPRDHVTGQRQIGDTLTCVVMKIDDEEYDFVVKCRPTTKEERQSHQH